MAIKKSSLLLAENPLCGIGEYKDVLDLSTGGVTRQIKKLVLTGEEIWDTGTVGANRFFYSYKQNAASIYASILSSHYIPSNVPGAQRPNNSIRQTTAATAAVINIRDDACATILDFKQYLASQYAAGTPVIVWYVLATPETETIAIPSGLTGTIEGYLTQSGTPTPSTPIYPEANPALAWIPINYRKFGTETDTITSLPTQIIGDGQAITSCQISGNTIQDRTPTPSDPVDVVGCGEKTENLFDVSEFVSVCRKMRCTVAVQGTVITIMPSDEDSFIGSAYMNGQIIPQMDRLALIPVQENTTYTLLLSRAPKAYITYVDSGYATINDNYIRITQTNSPIAYVFATPTGCSFVLFRLGKNGTNVYTYGNIMLVKGQKALSDFEPYGFKLPAAVNDTEYSVSLGQVPTTRRIKKLMLTGEEDVKSSKVLNTYQIDVSTSMNSSPTVICSHFQSVEVIPTSEMRNGKLFHANGVNNTNICFGVVNQFNAPSDFKQWLAAQYAAGTPVTVWYVLAEPETGIVNEPLMKIRDYADTVAVANIPTTGTPENFDVGTTLKPSEVQLTYRGWHDHEDTKYTQGG